MRWQLTLVASFALFVAVGCDEQPMEPVANSDLAQPTFDAVNPAQQYVSTNQDWSLDLCGIDEVRFRGTSRYLFRDDFEGDQIQGFFRERWDLEGLGYTTGLEWSLHAVFGDHESYMGPGDHIVFINKTIWNVIGKGDAPSFRWFVLAESTFNSAGELVQSNVVVDPLCD